jgi:hypothetical protein
MNSNGILHVTVNEKGHLRLWEAPGEAAANKTKNEVQIQISLTKSQMALVIRGEALAREKSRETVSPRP